MSGVQLKEEDPQVEEFVRWIIDLVAFVLPGSQAKEVEPLLAMLELGMVIDKAAELPRSDSLDNIMNRDKIYQSVLNLVGKIGSTPNTLRLVQMVAFLRLGLRASRLSLSPWTPLVLPRLHSNCLYWQTTTRTNPLQQKSTSNCRIP
jgi:hypothetical protein